MVSEFATAMVALAVMAVGYLVFLALRGLVRGWFRSRKGKVSFDR